MGAKSAEHLEIGVEWIHADLPLPTRYQIYLADQLLDLTERLPNVRFIDPSRLRVLMGRFVRQDRGKVASLQAILEEEIESLCDFEIVLEKPRVSDGHTTKYSIDLRVTDSRNFLRNGKRVRNRLIEAAGGSRFQAKGEDAGMRCIIGSALKGSISKQEMEQSLVGLGSLEGSFPWTFTPDRVQLLSRNCNDGKFSTNWVVIMPGLAQAAA